jgi:hypothetical protein
MSKVWDRVVEDLQKYSETPKEIDKPFWQKVWNVIMPSNSCTKSCNQGRTCDCFMSVNHDNRY